MNALRHLLLTDFIESAPTPLLKPAYTLTDVMRVFADNNSDFFYVSRDGAQLDGVVTLTNLLRAQSCDATADAPASTFMTREPAAITSNDTPLVAASAFREYGLKFLPVIADRQSRRIVGFIRARKLMASVMQQSGVGSPAAGLSAAPPMPPTKSWTGGL